MADDQTLRSYRPNDPYRRGQTEASDPNIASDPLAELARLIGQNDPYTDHARAARYGHDPRDADHVARQGDWRQHVELPVYQEEPSTQHQAYDQQHAYEQHQAYEMMTERDGSLRDPYRAPALHPDDYQDHHYAAARSDYHSQHAPYAHADAATPDTRGFGRYGDDAYDDPPQQRRGGALVTATILIGCAMLGTAGAYGYRAYYADTGPKTTPVIVADRSPSKIVPPGSQSKSKAQDQVAQTGSTERLVSREEQPVTIRPPGTSAAPRVVLPAPVASNGAPSVSAPAASSPESEPKRVRTVTIRPESGDPSGRPTGGGFPDVGSQPQPASPPPEAAAPPPRRAPERSVARAPAAQPPVASRDGNAPLSLQPGAPGPRAAAPSQRTLTAPAPREGAAPRVAALPRNDGNGGGYLVQISSQRSESDARASFRALQGKYPQVLRGRQAIVRRADLGSRGVYYRAMVGPFGSAAEANQLCRDLKAAGGQCIIQRN
jgi:hypothetical protein